jgi:hypothetical protein
MRSKAWLAALRLARLPRTASSAQRSRHLRSTHAAAPVFLAHTDVTKNIKYFSMGPKLRHPTGTHKDARHNLNVTTIHVPTACAERTGEAASVAGRRRESDSTSPFSACTHSN